jgi:hypothetical protein
MAEETWDQFKARVQAEGRWREAIGCRDRHKAEGKTPAEARVLTTAAFPPLADGKSPTPTAAVLLPSSAGAEPPAADSPTQERAVKRRWKGREGTRLDILGAITWAANNMDLDPDTLIAPSALAGALQRFARRQPDDFLKTYLPKLLPKDGSRDRADDDEPDPGLAMLDELLKRRARHGVTEEQGEATPDCSTQPRVVVPVQPSPQPEPEPAPASAPQAASPAPPLLCMHCRPHRAQQNGCPACRDLRATVNDLRARGVEVR